MKKVTSKISTQKMKKAIAHIVSVDKKLVPVIEKAPLCTIGRSERKYSHFESLVESVISQQLAVKAADTIYKRVLDLADGTMSPTKIAKITESDMRLAGVSGAKFKTIKGLSEASLDKRIDFESLHELDNDQLIHDQLISLWGIGPWTVDMFMIFQLGRLDVWPTGDLGVRRGWEKTHNLKELITPELLEKRGEKFRPYRSVVAWYCWRALEK